MTLRTSLQPFSTWILDFSVCCKFFFMDAGPFFRVHFPHKLLNIKICKEILRYEMIVRSNLLIVSFTMPHLKCWLLIWKIMPWENLANRGWAKMLVDYNVAWASCSKQDAMVYHSSVKLLHPENQLRSNLWFRWTLNLEKPVGLTWRYVVFWCR